MNMILSVMLALSVPPVTSGDSACMQAQYLLCHRHLNQTWLDSARTIVACVRQQEPTNEAGLCFSARICLLMGDSASGSEKKQDWYMMAAAAADTLRRRNPMNPDGHMWWATAQGRLGQLRGMLSSVAMVSALKREYEEVLGLDSGYALAWYALGRLYDALPSLMGGGLKRAEQYFRRGLVADSNYTVIRLELARVYSREHWWSEARRELGTLLATSQPTDPDEFALDDRPAAIALLDSIRSK